MKLETYGNRTIAQIINKVFLRKAGYLLVKVARDNKDEQKTLY